MGADRPGRGRPGGRPYKDTFLGAKVHRLAARRGAKRAAVAVAHALLVIVYHLLRRGTTFEELGSTYVSERDRTTAQHRLVHRLEGLGYHVVLTPLASAA